MAVETLGRGKTVEQKRPKVPATMAVMTPMSSMAKTCDGATPPKKKTRLNTGIEAAINNSTFASPAISLPVSSEKAESLEQSSRSKVCRSFSPLMEVEVKAGEIKTIKASCTKESRA